MVLYKQRALSFLRRSNSEASALNRSMHLPARNVGDGGFSYKLDTTGLLNESNIDSIPEVGKPVYSWTTDIWGMRQMLTTPVNLLLIFSPLGVMSAKLGWSSSYTFWFNFLAMVPLAGVLGNCTEELALHTGAIIGGLINATFGNAVEVILTVQALRAGLISVVQGTLLGSILSNILLVLGMAFLAGGLYFHVQKFNAQGATCSTSLLMLACLAFITPTIVQNDHVSEETVLWISRIVAMLIGVTYFLYLFFQLYTHYSLFEERKKENGGSANDEEDWPKISMLTSAVFLLLTTLIISYQSDCLVGSIEMVSKTSGIPESFIGVILLPVVGNAAEHVTAVSVAMKDKPDLTMAVAIGSSTQIAMFMVPFAVLSGWWMGIPMTLAFSSVAVVALVFAVLIVIGIVQDGESNWLEGVMLIVAYLIISVVFWFDGSSNVSPSV